MQEIPHWVDGLRWVFVALLLGVAYVGPKLFGPMFEKWKSSLPQQPSVGQHQFAVVGGALADRDAINRLAAAVERLCTIYEERTALEAEQNEEERLKKLMADLLRDQKR